MRLRWSVTASRHLASIHHYIAADKPDAATATVEKIIRAAEQLEVYPRLGRPGRKSGTRELIKGPFVIVYVIDNDVIDIRAVFHGNRKY